MTGTTSGFTSRRIEVVARQIQQCGAYLRVIVERFIGSPCENNSAEEHDSGMPNDVTGQWHGERCEKDEKQFVVVGEPS